MTRPHAVTPRLRGPYAISRTDLQAIHEALLACQRALQVQSKRIAAMQAQLNRIMAKQRSR